MYNTYIHTYIHTLYLISTQTTLTINIGDELCLSIYEPSHQSGERFTKQTLSVKHIQHTVYISDYYIFMYVHMCVHHRKFMVDQFIYYPDE